MSFKTASVFASLLALAAALPCRPSASDAANVTLPSTGTGSDLPPPPSGSKLVKIAVGHGLQNYTCASSTATAVNTGALAVLYDITSLAPGTPGTGLSDADWAALPAAVLNSQGLPLNMQNPDAVSPSNVLSESQYGAVVASPFQNPDPALTLPNGAPASALGHHFFDANGVPIFDLQASSGVLGSMTKSQSVSAPASADAGLLKTGAVAWLQLTPNANVASTGVKLIYRVLTAGGSSGPCSSLNGTGSVPYAAQYWFFN